MSAWILVVDDDPGTREALAAILTRAGYRVAPWDGAAGVEVAAAGRPFRLALVDYHLPGGTGLEVARRLKALAPDCRVILMSSEVPEEVSGLIDAFLRKPFSKGNLLSLVKRLWPAP